MRSCGKGEEASAVGHWRLASVGDSWSQRSQESEADGLQRLGSYLRNTHMAQPATNTPPRNMAKQ